MSKNVPVPLRPFIQPWPGLGTRVGFLDPGHGFLEDGSVNVMINRGDILAKRRGFVRGLAEYFDGAVCGLFRYTSTCGVESILVADQVSIKIRQPYAVPVFENSDAYPFDAFADDGFPNSYYWRNFDRYTQVGSALTLRAGQSSGKVATDFMRWFKDAASQSYQVRVEYDFNPDSATTQQVAVLIKGSDANLTNSIMGEVEFSNAGASQTYQLSLSHIEGGVASALATTVTIEGSVTNPTGFLTVEYGRDLATKIYRARATVIPFGGNSQSIYGDLNAVEDSSLGQTSALAISYQVGTQPTGIEILNVDGGPV